METEVDAKSLNRKETCLVGGINGKTYTAWAGSWGHWRSTYVLRQVLIIKV